jgi:hypothetical protein
MQLYLFHKIVTYKVTKPQLLGKILLCFMQEMKQELSHSATIPPVDNFEYADLLLTVF